MPDTSINYELEKALQKRDIDDLVKEVKEGFAGIHNRQDITNGKVLMNIAEIDSLKMWNVQQTIKEKYNKFIWYMFTVAVTVIVALSSYLLFHGR